MRELWGREYRVEDALGMHKLLNEDGMRDHPLFVDWAVAGRRSYVSGTFGYSDIILGCAGLAQMWDGCAEVWLIASEDFADFKKELVIYSRRILDTWQENTGFYRIQCTPEVGPSARFAEHLGFEKEGLMKKYGPYGRDCYMMARVQ